MRSNPFADKLRPGLRAVSLAFVLVISLFIQSLPARAASKSEIVEFLRVTGFDVAITSLQQGAMAGPGLTGEDPDRFGRQWTRLAEQVFDPDEMLEDAVDMLGAVLPDPLLAHGVGFYASPLGQRIVAVENDSHVTDDEVKFREGEALVTAMLDDNSIRLQLFRAMGEAIGSTETAIRSYVEIQLRYLLAAMAAGASDLDVSEEDLRLMLMSGADEMRRAMDANSLILNAYAYRDLTDDELIDYLSALQDPKMGQVYEILNGVQYEIMGDRYEQLATRLSELAPEQEL